MNITLDPSTIVTNDNFPDEQRPLSPQFLFGIVDTSGAAPVPVMPMLCAAVLEWSEEEIELERDDEDEGDDTPADADADEKLRTSLDKVTSRVDEDEQDDDDDDMSPSDDSEEEAEADAEEPVDLFGDTYTQPQLSLTIRLTAAVIADYKKYLATANEDAELVVQIAYGPNPKEPVFWHTYEIDASDLELIHTNSDSTTRDGQLVAYMTLPVLGSTKFNTVQ